MYSGSTVILKLCPCTRLCHADDLSPFILHQSQCVEEGAENRTWCVLLSPVTVDNIDVRYSIFCVPNKLKKLTNLIHFLQPSSSSRDRSLSNLLY
ncbi:hypothetical protein E2C01_074548 [Portunus trituberculatus]|uniref:Uncharacterized protein n=1 Tax=Portunus trituberculatus TaxID=210409 RepID=A0A5B7IGJ7_PORTR|nr:hypothetical protein [Portunus trituberculatus]